MSTCDNMEQGAVALRYSVTTLANEGNPASRPDFPYKK